MKIVIDTNIWVSLAIGSRSVTEDLISIIENSEAVIVVSEELLDEITTTLAKPKLRKYLTQERTNQLFSILNNNCFLEQSISNKRYCRDERDDFLINLAFDSSLQFLISGDLDLLILNPIDNLEILSIKQFLEFLK
jgi:putative PIN family toxin of toxin-antitoxin system